MKYIKPLLLICLLTMVFNACERDDICAESTPTTPHLVIRLYDIANPESTKNAFGFRAQGVGNDNALSNYNVVTADSIVVPLKTFENSTQFMFHIDYEIDDNGTPDDESDDIILGNEDIVTITYDTEEVYVSRACGFKTVFTITDFVIESDTDNWMLSLDRINDNIDNENAAHVQIFH